MRIAKIQRFCSESKYYSFSLLIFFHWVSVLRTEEIIKYSEQENCEDDEFYNINLLNCVKCNVLLNLVPSSDGFSCKCNKDSVVIPSIGGEFPRCQLCPPDQTPTADQRECIPCPATAVTAHTRDEVNNTFTECTFCAAGQIPVGRDWNGAVLENTTCLTCAPGYTPNLMGMCEPCTLRATHSLITNCTCPSSNNELLELPNEAPICVARKHLATWPAGNKGSSIEFENGEEISSQLLKDKLRPSVLLCQLGNRTACQCLANLCTLVMYKDEIAEDGIRPTACKIFRDAHRIPVGATIPGVDSRPWLMYGEGDSPSVLARRRISSLKFSLDPQSNNSLMYLRAAHYQVSGAFQDLSRGGANLLTLCPIQNERDKTGLRFGARYRISCLLHASHLLSHTTFLQDIYMQLPAMDAAPEKLYALPILVRNMLVNQRSDQSSWQLVRRMFLVDNVLGRTSRTSNVPQVLRYMKSCTIRVKVLGKEAAGQILPPLIDITYAELTKTQILQNEAVSVSLAVDWEMEYTSIYGIQVAAGVLGTLAAAWAGVSAWSQSRRDGRTNSGNSLDLATLARLILLACGPVANAFLLVAASSALLVLFFYKGQRQPHTLLPTADHENLINDLIISATVLKVVDILHLLWVQLQTDLFFMDWERPRFGSETVSIWRCYLVANEWNEIQATRRTSITLQLLLTIFLLQVVGLEHWASPDPELHVVAQANEKEGKSLILRFAVALTVYCTIYFIQWMLIIGFYERYIQNTIQQFIDLCSVANISVFLLTNENYGYYLHGRSAHGSADTDMRTLGEQLQREQEDLCAHRGLVPGTEQQTFEMALPPKMRVFWRRITSPLGVNTSQSNNRRLVSTSNKRGIMWQGNKEIIAQAYNTMNHFLAAFFQHAIRDLDYEVKEKALLEKLLDIELSDITEKAVLFVDDGHSFVRVLFHGQEFTLFTFDLLVFCCTEMISGDFLLSIIVTAFISKVLVMIRQYGGRRNVARKTLVDERFLI